MLSQWRMRRALEPLRSDCAVTRRDGIDLDSFLKIEIRDWYLNLLDTAPVHLLTLTDIAPLVAIEQAGEGCSAITLPQQCRRIIELNINNNPAPVEITAAGSPLALCQQNPFSRAGDIAPVAMLHGSRLTIYSASVPSIARLLCVMEPEDGYYELDEAALSLITTDM